MVRSMKKQEKYGNKASITIFFAMLIGMMSSFFFALLEAARVPGLYTKAEVVTDTAVESVFAEYQKEIYQNYGLLFLDGAYGSGDFQIEKAEQRLAEFGADNLYGTKKEIRDLYSMDITACEIEKYQLATDDGGAAFRHLAAATAKREAGEGLLEDFSDKIQQKEELETKNGTVGDHLAEAEHAKEEAEKQKKEDKEEIEDNNSAPNTQQDVKNPIEQVKEWKTRGVLSVVVQNEEAISKKAVAIEDSLERRQKQKGNLSAAQSAVDEIWFFKYLETHMGSYRNQKENRALDYEMEYILEGKSTDAENLEAAVKSIMKIREIGNLAYLVQDASKQTQAEELAATLMGWTLNPALITATKWGILGAWAYVESILDVRALLEGRQIAWIKNDQQWTADLDGIEENIDGFAMAKDCENGWDYTKYLQFLLRLKKNKDVNYRSMDIIEANTNVIADEKIQMDHMITACEAKISYEAEPLFWRFVGIGNFEMNLFQPVKKKKISYS